MSRKILFLLLVFCVTAVGCGSKSKKSGSATSGGDITISPATLKVAMPGVNYTQQLTATGGTAPYTWSAEGVLPGTVSLNSATGLLSGVPTSAGSYSFKVTVKDSSSPQLQGWRRYELIVTDGSIGWGRVSGNPVLDKGASGWDSGSIGMPCVIKESATSYKMWYTGTNTAPSSYFDFLNAETAIGLATSSDGVNWTKNSGNPVLAKNSNTSAPDSAAVGMASVIKDGSVYKMWYTGCKKESVMGFNYVVPNICYATSNDGINWTRYQSNPLIAGSVTYTVVSILPPAVDVVAKVYTAPWVIYDSSASLYKMWFTYAYVSGRVASTADMEKLMKSVVPSIGYATSPDGVN
ncbi:MAG: putative Ig domain-containing protein, partial [Planctomycetota bacterium]|nr:putative Ig domain-containing protein [Planctomycetota bacterium]